MVCPAFRYWIVNVALAACCWSTDFCCWTNEAGGGIRNEGSPAFPTITLRVGEAIAIPTPSGPSVLMFVRAIAGCAEMNPDATRQITKKLLAECAALGATAFCCLLQARDAGLKSSGCILVCADDKWPFGLVSSGCLRPKGERTGLSRARASHANERGHGADGAATNAGHGCGIIGSVFMERPFSLGKSMQSYWLSFFDGSSLRN